MKNAFEFSILIIITSIMCGYYFYYKYSQKIKSIKNNLNSNEINTFKHQIHNNTIVPNNHNVVSIPDVTQHGFHDYFAEKNGFNNNQLLGWRYWYLRNKSKYDVKPDDNFTNIPTRQYLNNMESLDNWFYDIND